MRASTVLSIPFFFFFLLPLLFFIYWSLSFLLVYHYFVKSFIYPIRLVWICFSSRINFYLSKSVKTNQNQNHSTKYNYTSLLSSLIPLVSPTGFFAITINHGTGTSPFNTSYRMQHCLWYNRQVCAFLKFLVFYLMRWSQKKKKKKICISLTTVQVSWSSTCWRWCSWTCLVRFNPSLPIAPRNFVLLYSSTLSYFFPICWRLSGLHKVPH